MFGIYFLILVIIIKLIRSIEPNWKEYKRIDRAEKNGETTYRNKDGYTTDLKTGQSYDWRYEHFLGENGHGDYLKVDPYNGKVIENITETCRKKYEQLAIEYARKNGYRYYIYEYDWDKGRGNVRNDSEFYSGYAKEHKNDKIRGYRYKDIQTGEIYILREYERYPSRVCFVINLNTGKLSVIWSSLKVNIEPDKLANVFSFRDNGRYSNTIDDTPENRQKILECIYERGKEDKYFNNYDYIGYPIQAICPQFQKGEWD